jgi:hypothetical protein
MILDPMMREAPFGTRWISSREPKTIRSCMQADHPHVIGVHLAAGSQGAAESTRRDELRQGWHHSHATPVRNALCDRGE